MPHRVRTQGITVDPCPDPDPGCYQRSLERWLAEQGRIEQPVCLGPDGRVWDGHHRIVAARRLGLTEIPVEPDEQSPNQRDDMACDFEHPHPEHPCGSEVVRGITKCVYCGRVDGDRDCHCWQPATEDDVDALMLDAWHIEPAK